MTSVTVDDVWEAVLHLTPSARQNEVTR